MDKFSFGSRDNSIMQLAYTVTDIEKEMLRYTELLHVGPWFLIGPFVPPKGRYRGAPTKAHFSLALAYSGELQVELIQQHDEEPSVFRETLKARGTHGFHHWGIGVRNFEKAEAHYRSRRLRGSVHRYRARSVGMPHHLFRHRTRPSGHARNHRDQRCDRKGISRYVPGSAGMERQRPHRPSELTALR